MAAGYGKGVRTSVFPGGRTPHPTLEAVFLDHKENDHMAVKIRLRRTGKKNAPAHRIVAADCRSPRDGRFIEHLGFYDPRNKAEKIELERYEYWLSVGAQPSETVKAIAKRAKEGKPMTKSKDA